LIKGHVGIAGTRWLYIRAAGTIAVKAALDFNMESAALRASRCRLIIGLFLYKSARFCGGFNNFGVNSFVASLKFDCPLWCAEGVFFCKLCHINFLF
jgi:hypothetical protein